VINYIFKIHFCAQILPEDDTKSKLILNKIIYRIYSIVSRGL